MSLHKKLAEIQKKLKAPKGQFNKFGNYSYRSCEDILEAVKPLLGDLSLIIDDTIELIGDRYYVVARVELSDGQDSVSARAYAREAQTKKGMDDAQITGAAGSYARKYALNGLFAIDDTKDADSTNDYGKKEMPGKQENKLDESKQKLFKEIGNNKLNESQLSKFRKSCKAIKTMSDIDSIRETLKQYVVENEATQERLDAGY
jgi:sugar diacid utilization regulator